MNGVFITGTDTNVGKTWVGVKIIKELKNFQITLKVRKPVESGWPEEINNSDAWKLANAAGQVDYLDDVCPFRFKAAISPERAAKLENKVLTLNEIVQSIHSDNDHEEQFLYIEGAGGFYSPLCSDSLNSDLAQKLGLPVVVIVDNRLGCINQALLVVDAIRQHGLEIKAIVLNDVDDKRISIEGMDNFADLKRYLSLPIIHLKHHDESNEAIKKLCSLLV